MNRRDFLKLAGLTALVAQLPATVLAAAEPPILVLVELKGGNDGLNTVIAHRDPLYRQLRPTLAVAEKQVLDLGDGLGLHPALRPLLPAWQAGELAWLLGVGYPRPNHSHFRSIEIWETASDSEQLLESGWVARSLPRQVRPGDGSPAAVVFDGGGMGAVRGEGLHPAVVQDPQRFVTRALRFGQEGGEASHNPALAHVLGVREELYRTGQALELRLEAAQVPAAPFPGHPLGRQLEGVARLLTAGVPVPVVKVGLGSFDTHVNQAGTQQRLLGQLAEALAAFRQAMMAAGLWQRVLVISYSEFGRRPRENANGGTDHGTAAPHLLLGGRVRGGFHGRQPSLEDLEAGDLIHTVDFRQLYATVARNWWGGRFDDRFAALDLLN